MTATTPAPIHARPRPRARRAAALTAAALLALAGCGSGGSSAEPAADDASDAAGSTSSLTVRDPWVKSAGSGMTAGFGTLVNDGDEDLVVTAVSSEVSPTTELHETVEVDGAMQMQQKDGGFAVPAGGELALEPGGNHLMLMNLQQPLRPGEQVELTLTLEGGDELAFEAVVKDFSGAEEDYAPGDGSGDMDMDMGDMDMGDTDMGDGDS